MLIRLCQAMDGSASAIVGRLEQAGGDAPASPPEVS
jgi:hypothetical protein